MEAFELYLPPVIYCDMAKKNKRAYRKPVQWEQKRIDYLKANFATNFNKDLAAELGCGWRTVIRKARELGLEKEPCFLDKNRPEIVKRIQKVRIHSPHQQGKGYCVPNSEQFRFKAGNIPASKTNTKVAEKARITRNETIRRDRIRLSFGLPQKTKLKLKI